MPCQLLWITMKQTDRGGLGEKRREERDYNTTKNMEWTRRGRRRSFENHSKKKRVKGKKRDEDDAELSGLGLGLECNGMETKPSSIAERYNTKEQEEEEEEEEEKCWKIIINRTPTLFDFTFPGGLHWKVKLCCVCCGFVVKFRLLCFP